MNYASNIDIFFYQQVKKRAFPNIFAEKYAQKAGIKVEDRFSFIVYRLSFFGGKWKVEGGRWKVESGKWKVEGGK